VLPQGVTPERGENLRIAASRISKANVSHCSIATTTCKMQQLAKRYGSTAEIISHQDPTSRSKSPSEGAEERTSVLQHG
jgi:hypothetical protein